MHVPSEHHIAAYSKAMIQGAIQQRPKSELVIAGFFLHAEGNSGSSQVLVSLQLTSSRYMSTFTLRRMHSDSCPLNIQTFWQHRRKCTCDSFGPRPHIMIVFAQHIAAIPSQSQGEQLASAQQGSQQAMSSSSGQR